MTDIFNTVDNFADGQTWIFPLKCCLNLEKTQRRSEVISKTHKCQIWHCSVSDFAANWLQQDQRCSSVRSWFPRSYSLTVISTFLFPSGIESESHPVVFTQPFRHLSSLSSNASSPHLPLCRRSLTIKRADNYADWPALITLENDFPYCCPQVQKVQYEQLSRRLVFGLLENVINMRMCLSLWTQIMK